MIGDDEPPSAAGELVVGGLVTQITAGAVHFCVLLESGYVRCWGHGEWGALGYSDLETIGDDEVPATAGTVGVGGSVVSVVAGGAHTCVLLDTGAVRCWGYNGQGQLGYGNVETIGDDELPIIAGDVDVGGAVAQIAAGLRHTCVILDDGRVRCWGEGLYGRLGYGNCGLAGQDLERCNIGDDETPASAGDVDLGGPAVQIVAGDEHTCALLQGGTVRCWGDGHYSQLGYPGILRVGEYDTPASVGDVDLGGTATHITAGKYHTCALLESGAIRCWGQARYGQPGYGCEPEYTYDDDDRRSQYPNSCDIGDDETPASAGDVPVF